MRWVVREVAVPVLLAVMVEGDVVDFIAHNAACVLGLVMVGYVGVGRAICGRVVCFEMVVPYNRRR